MQLELMHVFVAQLIYRLHLQLLRIISNFWEETDIALNRDTMQKGIYSQNHISKC